MTKLFNKNDRVKYVGKTWPDRIGRHGIVLRDQQPDELVVVILTGEIDYIRCFATSLENLKPEKE